MSFDRNRGTEQWSIPPQTEDPRFNLDEEHPGLIPGQTGPEGRQEGYVIEHDSDTDDHDLTDPFEEDRQLAERVLDNETEKPEPRKMSPLKKITTGALVALGIGGVAGTTAALNSDDDRNSVPPTQPTAEAPVSPGQTEASKENNFENLSLDNFPFEINGETIVGIEALRQKLEIDTLQYPDVDSATKRYVELISLFSQMGTSEADQKKYAGYVSPVTGERGVEGLDNDIFTPAAAAILGTSGERAAIYGQTPDPYLEEPLKLYDYIDQMRTGNRNGEEISFELKENIVKGRAHEYSLSVTSGEDNVFALEPTILINEKGLSPMEVTWRWVGVRANTGTNDKEVWTAVNFTAYPE